MGIKVLLADDSQTIQKVIQLSLQNDNYEIKCVSTGSRVMEIAEGFQPEIVLLDVSLPEIDGYTLAKQFNSDEKLKNAHIFFLCNAFEKIKEEELSTIKHAGKLIKPFDPNQLRDMIGKLVGGNNSAPTKTNFELPKNNNTKTIKVVRKAAPIEPKPIAKPNVNSVPQTPTSKPTPAPKPSPAPSKAEMASDIPEDFPQDEFTKRMSAQFDAIPTGVTDEISFNASSDTSSDFPVDTGEELLESEPTKPIIKKAPLVQGKSSTQTSAQATAKTPVKAPLAPSKPVVVKRPSVPVANPNEINFSNDINDLPETDFNDFEKMSLQTPENVSENLPYSSFDNSEEPTFSLVLNENEKSNIRQITNKAPKMPEQIESSADFLSSDESSKFSIPTDPNLINEPTFTNIRNNVTSSVAPNLMSEFKSFEDEWVIQTNNEFAITQEVPKSEPKQNDVTKFTFDEKIEIEKPTHNSIFTKKHIELNDSLIDKTVNESMKSFSGEGSFKLSPEQLKELSLSQEMIQKIVTESFRDVVEKIAWKVVPDIAENIIKKELEKILGETGRTY